MFDFNLLTPALFSSIGIYIARHLGRDCRDPGVMDDNVSFLINGF